MEGVNRLARRLWPPAALSNVSWLLCDV